MSDSHPDSVTGLHKLFEESLLRGRRFPRQSSGNFRPSEASVLKTTPAGPIVQGGCARACWYRLKGIPPSNPEALAHQIMRAKVGKRVEESCIEQCKQMGIYVANSVQFHSILNGVPISGELDAILSTEPCGGINYAAEVKSLYSYLAQKSVFGHFLPQFTAAGPGAPKVGHLLQLALYLCHFSRLSANDPAYLPFGALHYVDRGDGHFGTYDVELVKESRILPEGGSVLTHKIAYWSKPLRVPYTVTSYSIEDCLQRFAMIQTLLEGETPPPRDYDNNYSKEKVEAYHTAGLISDSAYNKFMKSHGPRGKGKETISDWNCYQIYCSWSDLCWGCSK